VPHVKAALTACIVATLATATATFCYVAFDLGLIGPGFIIYAPVIPALVVAIPVGILLGIARQRLGRAAFTILALLVSTLSGLALGEVVIGSSDPRHTSHVNVQSSSCASPGAYLHWYSR
jgi:hypothetical protein